MSSDGVKEPVETSVKINDYELCDLSWRIWPKLSKALEPFGITVEEDGEDHDGFIVLNFKRESEAG